MTNETKILIDLSSEKDHNNQLHIEGDHDTIVDVFVQLFENNDDLADMFFYAVEDYYKAHPEKRPII